MAAPRANNKSHRFFWPSVITLFALMVVALVAGGIQNIGHLNNPASLAAQQTTTSPAVPTFSASPTTTPTSAAATTTPSASTDSTESTPAPSEEIGPGQGVNGNKILADLRDSKPHGDDFSGPTYSDRELTELSKEWISTVDRHRKDVNIKAMAETVNVDTNDFADWLDQHADLRPVGDKGLTVLNTFFRDGKVIDWKIQTFPVGELVWFDKDSGKPLFKFVCGNVLKPAPKAKPKHVVTPTAPAKLTTTTPKPTPVAPKPIVATRTTTPAPTTTPVAPAPVTTTTETPAPTTSTTPPTTTPSAPPTTETPPPTTVTPPTTTTPPPTTTTPPPTTTTPPPATCEQGPPPNATGWEFDQANCKWKKVAQTFDCMQNGVGKNGADCAPNHVVQEPQDNTTGGSNVGHTTHAPATHSSSPTTAPSGVSTPSNAATTQTGVSDSDNTGVLDAVPTG